VQHRQHDLHVRVVDQPVDRTAGALATDAVRRILWPPSAAFGQRAVRRPPAAVAVEVDRPDAPTTAIQVLQHLRRRRQRDLVFRRAPAGQHRNVHRHRITPPW
jgi:hypothetical protein